MKIINKDKITDIVSDVTERSKPVYSNFIRPILETFGGYGFYGKRNIAKDGSYTTTLWLVFCYFPIHPLDSYRIHAEDEKLASKVYGIDDFMPFDIFKIEFDWVESVSTMVAFWLPVLTVVFFLFIYPLAVLPGILVLAASVATYQLQKHSRKQNTPQPPAAGENLPKKVPTPSAFGNTVTFESMPVPKPKIAPIPAKVPLPKPPRASTPAKRVQASASANLYSASVLTSSRSNIGHFPPVIEIPDHPRRREARLGLNFLGILNIALVLGYVYYFGLIGLLAHNSTTATITTILTILTRSHLLAIVSFNLGVGLALFRSKTIGIILILLAAALFLNLHTTLWTQLYHCCIPR